MGSHKVGTLARIGCVPPPPRVHIIRMEVFNPLAWVSISPFFLGIRDDVADVRPGQRFRPGSVRPGPSFLGRSVNVSALSVGAPGLRFLDGFLVSVSVSVSPYGSTIPGLYSFLVFRPSSLCPSVLRMLPGIVHPGLL